MNDVVLALTTNQTHHWRMSQMALVRDLISLTREAPNPRPLLES